MPLGESSELPESIRRSTASHSLDAVRLLHAAGGALLVQAALHGQLARLEWAHEKNRLLKMLAIALLGFASLLCVTLLISALLLALYWDTTYRIPVALALIALHGVGVGVAWHRFQGLLALGSQSFSATRKELAADIALLRSAL